MTNVSTTFTLFPQLPTELRLKIWQFSFQHPRIVEFRARSIPILHHGNGGTVSHWSTKCPPQSELSVCRESRKEALKFWTLRFPLRGTYDRVVYMNLQQDTIFLPGIYGAYLWLLRDIGTYNTTGCGVRFLGIDLLDVPITGRLKVLKDELPVVAPTLEWLYLVVDRGLGGIQRANWEHDWDPNVLAIERHYKDRGVPKVRTVALTMVEAARTSN